MKFLFCGDVVGKSGRDVACHHIPLLRKKLNLDFVIINAENAAHGFGITKKIADQFYASGVDVITTGNHIWDQKETIAHISAEPRLLRPLNFPKKSPGKGYTIVENARGHKLMVVNVMGQMFMESLDDPFQAVDDLLSTYKLGQNVQAVLVDIHAEANSEKVAMGHFLDGRATLVAGTHTHIPTADYMILKNGTAYITDVGMTGDYDSVIGMNKNIVLERFVKKIRGEKLQPAEGSGTLCGVFVESDDATGKAIRIKPLRIDGILDQTIP
ncbi:MAG: TIGR00282 family metallophosphoesterase [Alphaproteobacteria bacterium]|nr:TIGR00282 family metallophosphoesterase [Alphaproteobacteria bacterium]